MKKIFNLTQHTATPEQVAAGVVEPEDKSQVQGLLTFDELPSRDDIQARAKALAELVKVAGVSRAMVGGAPYLMPALVDALKKADITTLFSFTKRVSVDEVQPDGTVIKKSVFKHDGWVEV